jgi:uncharacterized protein with GYD domain
MPFYLVQLSYTGTAWNTLIKEPQNRLELVRPSIEDLGGKVENAFLSFGEYDVVALFQLPSNVDAAAVSMMFMAGGAPRQVKITPLLTWEEGVQAMKKAKKATYAPPKKNPMLDRDPE